MWARLVAGYLCTAAAHAQDAIWLLNPGSGDWNTATNWSPATVPLGTATLDNSNVIALTISSATFIQTLHFTAAAPAYSFNLTGDLTFQGAGIVNDSSSIRPSFTTNGRFIQFSNTSSAGNAVIATSTGGIVDFENASTASNASITSSGLTEFFTSSLAGTAIITTNSGGRVEFNGASTGDHATFITNVGGTVDISKLTASGITTGSIEGGGTYALGSKALTVGLNNLSTEVSGVITDVAASGETGGSLIKVGTGSLTLSGINNYTGGTTITGGEISVATDANLGATAGGLTLQGGELLTTNSSFNTARTVALSGAGPNTLAATTGSTATYTGVLSGTALQVGDLNGHNGIVVLRSSTNSTNSYVGGTSVVGGATLNADIDAELGSGGSLTLDSGKLTTSGDTNGMFTTTRAIILGAGGGTLAAPSVNILRTATMNGQISGPGSLTIGDANSQNYQVVLRNNGNNYEGGTTVVGVANGASILSVDTDAELGQGGITLSGGTLLTTGSAFSTERAIALVTTPGHNTLEVSGGTTATYNGLISGNGPLTLLGAGGTIVLNKLTNSYTGGTVVSFATLIVPDDHSLGLAGTPVTIQGGELLTITDGFTSPRPIDLAPGQDNNDVIAAVTGQKAAYTGLISGTGALQIGDGVQSGELVFTNKLNSYSGGTTIVGSGDGIGVLFVDVDSELGATNGGITLTEGALVTTANFVTSRTIFLNSSPDNVLAALDGTTATYNGVISGPGGLILLGTLNPSTIILHGNNLYAGGTLILGVTVVAGANGAVSNGPVQVSSGIFDIPGGVTLSNTISLQGGTADNAGTLNNSITGTGTPNVVMNSGTINGNVTLTGGTDTVQLFTGSKITGNLSLTGTQGSTLILDGTGPQLFSSAVTGTVANNGSLAKQGTGTWTIDEDLTAPVATNVLAGTLVLNATLTTVQVNISPGAIFQLGTGGTTGSYTGPIVANGSLIFNRSDSVTIAGSIRGSGNVIQAGTGKTVLSGANTYSGGTIVDLGNLVVDSSTALGTGDVAVNGGVLSADPQPINVAGNYTQAAGGTLQLNIAGRTPGQFDVLNVGGNAFLNGTLRLVNQGYQPANGDKLRLISTGGTISGRFSTFINPFTPPIGFTTIDLVYARQSLTLEFLKLTPPVPPAPPIIITTDFSSFAVTPNQLAAANLLDAVQLDPRATNLISFLNAEPFANLPNDFQKISPEGLTAFYEISFSNANLQKLNLEGRMDDIHRGSNGFSSNMKVNGATVNLEERADADGKSAKAVAEPILQHVPENHWGVWVTGFGDFVNVDGDGNARGYNFTTGGVSLGIDYRITDQLAVGVMGEYAHTWTSLHPNGHIDVDSGRGGVYATWFSHGIYVNGAIYGGHNNYDSGRSSLGGLANGSTEGAEWSTFLGGGYDFHLGPLTVGPIASLQYTDVGIDDFSEKGSLAALAIHSGSAESLRSDVGFRVFYQWQIGKIILEPSLKVAWEHEYKYSALPITAGFAGIPGPSSTFFGPSEGHDSAVVNAGVSVQVTPAISMYVNYDGQLGRGNYDSNAVTGGVRISF
jgi:outer membrane autotransporter protein